jgi:hypothetical protein
MFNANSSHGILVDTDGAITLTGTPTSGVAGTGTVVTNGNSAAGIWIAQTPTGTAPQSTVTGLVAWGSPDGNGMRIVAGSHVAVRGSAFLSNKVNGVIVSTGAGNYNDISLIDLGDGTTLGGNTFQGTLSAGANGGAGLCLSIAANRGQTLLAEGDSFRGVDCSAAATLLLNTKGCGNSATACAGGICDLGFGAAQTAVTPNAFNVMSCTQ